MIGLSKLHIKEPHDLYIAPDIIRMFKTRRMKWVGYVARMKETRNTCRVFVGKQEEKRPLGRHRSRW
jgi:hypothetical protein